MQCGGAENFLIHYVSLIADKREHLDWMRHVRQRVLAISVLSLVGFRGETNRPVEFRKCGLGHGFIILTPWRGLTLQWILGATPPISSSAKSRTARLRKSSMRATGSRSAKWSAKRA